MAKIDMSEASLPILVAIVSAGSAVIAAIISFVSTKKKNEADAVKILTGSALDMVQALNRRIEKLEQRVSLQEDTIKYLWDGIGVLTEQIEQLGAEPRFKPKIRFRGTNGDEFDFE